MLKKMFAAGLLLALSGLGVVAATSASSPATTQYVTVTTTFANTHRGYAPVIVDCPANKRVVGGGFDIRGSFPTLADQPVVSRDMPFENRNAWYVEALIDGSGNPVTIQAFAVCSK